MTNEEAIALPDGVEEIMPCTSDAVKMAKKALEKQIRQKPIDKSDDMWMCKACPSCHGIVGLKDKRYDTGGFIFPACECGQRIDWSVIE